MTDAQDTLKNRLEHAQCLVDTFLTAEIHERIPQRLMDGLLFSLQELLEQAKDAFEEMSQQSKPKPQPGNSSEHMSNERSSELLAREIVSLLEDAVLMGRQLIRSATPGEAS